MKFISFCSKISLALIFAGFLLSSCKKGPELSFSKDDIIFDASGVDTAYLQVAANVTWTATVKGEWLNANTLEGNGNATIKLWVDENGDFSERVTYIVISGDDMQTDSIKVIQESSFDVAERIEDEAFRKYCLNLFDDSGDGKISLREAKNTEITEKTKITVSGRKIKTLAGIEYFTKIKELDCHENQIKEIDVSKNKELEQLNCSKNQIEDIEVGALTKLEDLRIFDNKFKNIDISQNENLLELWISDNLFTSIDISNNRKLYLLSCSYNRLTTLDVRNNTELQTLSCTNNELTTFELQSNTKLIRLYCSENRLSTIDLSNNKDLQSLYCTGTGNYKITSLNLTNNVNLKILQCDNNNLSSLNLSRNTALEQLYCSSCNLQGALDISANVNLKKIDLQTNNLTSIKVWSGFNTSKKEYKKDPDDKTQWVW